MMITLRQRCDALPPPTVCTPRNRSHFSLARMGRASGVEALTRDERAKDERAKDERAKGQAGEGREGRGRRAPRLWRTMDLFSS